MAGALSAVVGYTNAPSRYLTCLLTLGDYQGTLLHQDSHLYTSFCAYDFVLVYYMYLSLAYVPHPCQSPDIPGQFNNKAPGDTPDPMPLASQTFPYSSLLHLPSFYTW